ncbi:hypothetical protein QJS83_13285 [Bdellovibrio sp. 22V]|uniref:hypothetical protein n=1 Tax=Bdellovibrio TaxID=958 RepID=UPI00254364D0|nr:hypothetical protein [Bdellovibrio sp. 22V]WII71437.1 hypothetical protein QJS83_13285 [Bdellovibrio sp. 22V]
MPEIKNYDGKKKHGHKGDHHKKHEKHHAKHSANKRRPHHEEPREADEIITDAEGTILEAADIMEETDAINTEAQNEGVKIDEAPIHDFHAEANMAESNMAEDDNSFETEAEKHEEKTHLEFYGSELIRQKAPKVMELADSVAEEWKKDGQFEGLPVGNPLAQIAAAKALRTAKDVEKKLEEKGVFVMAKMGLDYVKSKIEKKH